MNTHLLIVSLRHTRRTDPYITFWRPEAKGYAWPLSWAGKFTREEVLADPAYFNNGESTIAIDPTAVEPLGIAPKKGTVDGDTGPVVPNNAASWEKILAAVAEAPKETPRPQFRGSPHKECFA